MSLFCYQIISLMKKNLLLIILSLFTSFSLQCQNSKYNFGHLVYSDGLSHNNVLCFAEDNNGFLWIGTKNGLNRFDGYNFKVFKHHPSNSNSLPDNFIYDIVKDQLGRLWLRLPNGLSILNPTTEKFTNQFYLNCDSINFNLSNLDFLAPYGDSILVFKAIDFGLILHNIYTNENECLVHNPNDNNSLSPSLVSHFIIDNNILYIVHQNGIIDAVDIAKKKVIDRNYSIYKMMKGEEMKYKLFQDSKSNHYLVCEDQPIGLVKIDPQGNLKLYNTQSDTPLNSNIVSGLIEDSNKNIWIGTDHGGINILHTDENKIEYLTNNIYNENSLSQNVITKLYKSSDSTIWVGTFKQGINYYHKNLFRFFHYSNHQNDLNSLPYNDVNCFAEDKSGNLWIGTNGKGLIYFDRQKNKFKTYNTESYANKGLKSNVIVSLYVDKQNNLWIGTYHGGLSVFDGEKFKNYSYNQNNPKSISDNKVWEIFEDSAGNMWIGMLGGGLNMFDREKEVFHKYSGEGLNLINSTFVMDITQDKDGNIWFGTDNGLFVMDKQSSRFVHYTQTDKINSLSNDFVYNVFVDSKGNIWVGTRYGLNLFDKESNNFIKFDTKNGLADNSIMSILESEYGNLWLGTSNGLTKLMVRYNDKGQYLEHDATNFNESDGLQGREFNEGSAFRTSAGELIFGGPNGFNLFIPEDETNNSKQRITHIIGLEIFGNKVELNNSERKRKIIDKSILDNETIKLNSNEKMYSLEWVNINYLGRKDINYRYKLEGFNENWIYTDWDNRKATFTNLNPGKYQFLVQASDYQTNWNESESSVYIQILPPWYKTILAYFTYFIIVGVFFLVFRRMLIMRERGKFQKEQAIKESDRQMELNVLKTRFFTNVSHEFRTPLSLIITPLERLLSNDIDNSSKKHLELIYQNARRLLTLVNQLLDFRKAEENKNKLNLIYGDIVGLIGQTIESFSDLKESKHIELDFITFNKALFMQFDKDKIEKIITNLLSNAFKFTSENGSIKVITKVIKDANKEYFKIIVEDTGIGIAEKDIDKVFERFYQTELPNQFIPKGSGIGLSLTKDFVELHNGSVSVKSKPNKGSSFIVVLPVNRNKLNELAEKTESHVTTFEKTEPISGSKELNSEKKTILLVEDNAEFREYIKESLAELFNIIEAENGKLALQSLEIQQPDLIVSDIMMPVMDGLELCNEIKQNANYSHIPIILLTAKSTQQDKLEGLKHGADEYLTKPFNYEILESRIKYLLQLRQRFINRYQNSLEIEPNSKLTSIDEKLLKKALKIVEKNIATPELSVESLSKDLGMSRVNLYKKMTSLTGKSPVEFIRLVRLKKAAELLLTSQMTVSEIAYDVGYSDPRYFSKQFKAEYGVLPSKFKENQGLE